PSRALWIGVSVLVVTCPCALALATPAALTAATTRLARQGVLITRGHALETLARVTDVVFDKTGTLTRGQLNVEQVLLHADADETECRALAAALEQGSRHPLALALLAGQVPASVVASRHHVGSGVEGKVSSRLAQRISVSVSAAMSPSRARYTGTAYIITCIDDKPATNQRHSATRRSRCISASRSRASKGCAR
ncbi:MAG: HAD family hydrolase, partial [Betaproteobacteria bacterium]|nr:HAD family hydrolase [Betaproteobacteria bacterium]